jgi:hypothetical protein
MRAMEEIGFFTGLGVVIVMLAAMSMGRISAVPGVTAVTPVPDGGYVAPEPVTAPVTTVPAQSVPAEDTQSID